MILFFIELSLESQEWTITNDFSINLGIIHSEDSDRSILSEFVYGKDYDHKKLSKNGRYKKLIQFDSQKYYILLIRDESCLSKAVILL